MPNVSHGSVHDGSPFAIPGTLGVNFIRGEFVSLSSITELAVAFDVNLEFLGVIQRALDLTNAIESGSIPFAADSVNTVLIVNRELPFANSGGPIPFSGAFAFADSATTFTLDSAAGKFCGVVRMVDQVNGPPLWIIDTRPARTAETTVSARPAPIHVFFDYEDAAVSGEAIVPFPTAGTITEFSVVNSVLTSGAFDNGFSLAINGTTVTNGEILIPPATAGRTVFSIVPTADNILAPGDALSVLVAGGSNTYVAGFFITIAI